MVCHEFVVHMSVVVNTSGRVWGRVHLLKRLPALTMPETGRAVVRVGGCN